MKTVKEKAMILMLGVFLFVAGYLLLGYLFHFVIFPETKPDPKQYVKPGDRFGSTSVGDELTVIDKEGDYLRVQLAFAPRAEGPPLHIHSGWDERFKTQSGKLGLIVNGEKKALEPGESTTVRKGIAHKPYNADDGPTVAESSMPAVFVMYLSQVYGFIDEDEKNLRPPRILLQMALFNQYFDSYLGDGPPVFIQKIQNVLLIPAARLLGYRSFYEKYRIPKSGSETSRLTAS